jgi:citrate lyase subunit beta / citryl-CoA lyase
MAGRSWLFVPAFREDFFEKAFSRGADVVVLDLEDGVPASEKERARTLAGKLLERRLAWVRVNRVGTDDCERDLAAVTGRAAGVRAPKVESAEEAAWVVAHAASRPVACAIETAVGLVNSLEIARTPGVTGLVFGVEDYRRDVGCTADAEALRYARSHLVVVSRAAGIERPIDGAYVGIDDLAGLLAACVDARKLGFAGKSVVHPAQIEIVNRVFAVTNDEVRQAADVLAAFDESGGRPTRLSNGDLVDLPVAERARALLGERDDAR